MRREKMAREKRENGKREERKLEETLTSYLLHHTSYIFFTLLFSHRKNIISFANSI
jgi:hypothetical protein